MKVMKLKFKYLGKMETVFQVVDAQGEVLQVLETEEDANKWLEANK